MTEGIDWIARAGAKAKGRRPEFHDDPAIDRLLSLTMAVVGEVSVLRERMDTVERLLDHKGSISRADIDAYVPDRAAAEERGLATRAYIARESGPADHGLGRETVARLGAGEQGQR